MKNSNLDRILERVGDLPAMPEVVSQVLSRIDDPNSNMDTVSHILERDPALAARILRVSNSPYFGMRQNVGTLKLAMVILGVREIRNIVLGVSLFDTLRDADTDRLLKDRFWQDAFRVASLSKRLGQALKLGCQGEDFISGLLHGMGKMVLCRHLQKDYAPIISEAADDDALVAREREVLGFSYADVSAALGERWNLPQAICDAIWLHYPNPEMRLADAKDPRMAATVRIAYYAKRGILPAEPVRVDEALAQTEAWAALGTAPGELAESGREAALLSLVEEIADAPPEGFA